MEGQAESFKLTFRHTFVNFMVMQIRKPENEDTLFSELWKEEFSKRREQDWSKISWKEEGHE